MRSIRSIHLPPAILWVLLFIGLLTPSAIWIAEDRAVWWWDQAWYAEVSTDLSYWMVHSVRRWVGEMADGMSLKPPGIVWLGQFFVPLRHVFGSVEISLLVSILATQLVLLAILFRIGRQLCPHSNLGAVAGVTLAAGGALFVALSHQYLVESLQTAAVAWTYYVAIEARRWPRPRVALQLALALMVGAIAKADTLLYCVLPCLYAAGPISFNGLSRADFSTAWKSRGFRLEAVLLAFLGGATGLWYYRNLRPLLQHAYDASFGKVALDYGIPAPWSHKFVDWAGLSIDSFFAPYLGWVFLAVLAGACVGGVLRLRPRRETARIEPIAIVGVLQILLSLSMLSTGIIVEPRFLYPLLPGFAVVFLQLCAYLPASWLAVTVVACGAQWAVVNAESLGIWGAPSPPSELKRTPELNRSHHDDVTGVVRLTSDAEERNDIIGVECDWMNANSASFFSAKNRLETGVRSRYTSLGYAESDLAAAMRRIGTFRARYVVTLAEPFQAGLPDFLNVVSLPVLREMRSDSRFKQVPYASRNGVLVFRVQEDLPADAGPGSAR